MLRFARRELLRALPLLVATGVVGVGAYFVCVSAIGQLQSTEGEYVARSFAKYLVQQVPDLAGIVQGRVSDGSPLETLATIRPIGSVFKFRIYDDTGALKVDSSPFAAGHLVSARNSFQDATAAQVAVGGHASYSLQRGDGRVLPSYYSEVMVPLVADNRPVGVLSVISDESESWPNLLGQFRSVIAQVVALIIVAFGVPVALYLRKLGQLELAARRLRHSIRHDDLTGILNRPGFVQVLAEAIETMPQRNQSIGVHVFDLDRFKDVNDANGHRVGDEVLKQASERIRRLLGTSERMARLGADEFAILQPFSPARPETARDLAEEVARVMARPFRIDGKDVQVGASIGCATYPEVVSTAEALMRAADAALRHAKRHSRGHAVSFDRSMEAERRIRHRIDSRLRAALAADDFKLHFQPVFETASRRLRGFEALLRLADDDGQPISPDEFIPVAEEIGLINDIGRWVLREACRAARDWPDDLFVAVNLSAAQFAGEDMAARVREVLEWSKLRPARLELEVTESLLITDTDRVLRDLKAIRALGPTLALDDFGTGYSSLSYLWRFPFDKLKVDRSFMGDLTVSGTKSREILATIIALGRVLNLTITAEGVETEEQAAVLRELRCDLVQGYLYGRPQPASQVGSTISAGIASAELDISGRAEPVLRLNRRG